MVPHRVPGHGAGPDRLQVTPWSFGSLLTVAKNGCVPLVTTLTGVGGETETAIPVGALLVMLMVAEADVDGVAFVVAVSVTVRPAAGTLAGAL